MEHILNLEQVKKYYGGNSGNITKAVDGISMAIPHRKDPSRNAGNVI